MDVVKDPDNRHEQMLTAMVEQYEAPLFRTCYMVLKDRGLAEDAVQETFLKAYRAMDHFRGECSEKTWLMRIAMNTCRDMTRMRWFRFEDRTEEPELLMQPVTPCGGYDSLDLASALMKLPLRYRQVVLLYYYHNMSMAEAAEALNISAATVHKRLKQACARLEQLLGRGYLHG